jgi:3-oxoacyl-[acyl-carrier protein] reductase
MVTLPRALVTGATRGIGRAIAEALAVHGYEVFVNYAHDEAAASETVAEIRRAGRSATAVKADVTDEGAVARLFADLHEEGPIDLLVNNVGDFLFKPFLDTTSSDWERVLRSNLTSAVLCCRAVLPKMRSRRSGGIVNVASMNAEILRAKPNTLPYAVANAGLILLTKTLAATEGTFGIRVNAVCPGFVETGSYPPADVERTIPLGRLARASEIGNVVAFLASDEASYVTGSVFNAHGGAFL